MVASKTVTFKPLDHDSGFGKSSNYNEAITAVFATLRTEPDYHKYVYTFQKLCRFPHAYSLTAELMA